MFFAVRKDVTSTSGQQRVFGCYDTAEEAWKQVDWLTTHMKGDFGVEQGTEVERPSNG